jgi:type VI secretion system ImpH/TssG family protein
MTLVEAPSPPSEAAPATPASTPDVALLRKLAAEPWTFGFYEAMRRLEALHSDRPRLGRSARPAQDAIRLSQEPAVVFTPSSLSGWETDAEGGAPRLAVSFFGLFGVDGPLPLHLTEYAQNRRRNFRDPTFKRFADIFHHRLLSLFYRAWADSRPTVSFDRPADDRFATYVGALVGLGMGSLRDRDAMPDLTKLHFAGHLANQTRHAEGLATILSSFFIVPVRVECFIGAWLTLQDREMTEISRTSLCSASSTRCLRGHRGRHRLLQAARQPLCRAGALAAPDPPAPGFRPASHRPAIRDRPCALAADITAALDRLPRGATAISDFSPTIEEAVERGWVFGTLMFGESRCAPAFCCSGTSRRRRCATRCMRSPKEFEKVKAEALTTISPRSSPARPRPGRRADGSGIGGGTPGEASGAMAPAQMGKQEALAKFTIDLTERRARARSTRSSAATRDPPGRRRPDAPAAEQPDPDRRGRRRQDGGGRGLRAPHRRGDVPPQLKDVSLRTLDVGCCRPAPA